MFKGMKPLPKAIIMLLITIMVVFGGKALYQAIGSGNKTADVVAQKSEDRQVPVTANSMKSIVDTGTVHVSLQSQSKPFFAIDHGVPTGFNYDFMKLLFAQSEFTAKHARIEIDVASVVDTYADVPAALLKSAKVDIAIDGLTFTNDDLPGVVYTVPYIDDFGYALIVAANTTIRSIADAEGLTIGILQGDPDVKAYVKKQFPKSTLKELSDASTAQGRTWINDAIKSGKVDAVVYDYPFASAEIANTDLQFAISKLPDSNLKYKIGVRQGDTELLENLNIAIRKVKADPRYVDLIKTYFATTKLAKVVEAVKSETVYVVKVGDTLSTIAATILGNKMRYSEIEVRNNLPNPNLIQVGQQLIIPKV